MRRNLKGVAIDGVDLLPLATGEGADNWNRETLFWQNGHYQVVRHGDWKLQVNDRPTDGMQKWLYNLAEDPTEQNNLAASHPDKLEELRPCWRHTRPALAGHFTSP